MPKTYLIQQGREEEEEEEEEGLSLPKLYN